MPKLKDVLYGWSPIYKDSRGEFVEIYKKNSIAGLEDKEFVQTNLSTSDKYVFRGMHYQYPPFTQGKFVRALSGKVLDIIVDLRKSSPTFLQAESFLLESKDNYLYVPEGFAHGFVALEKNTMFYYQCTNFYSQEHENGLFIFDEDLGLEKLIFENWSIEKHNLIISHKDLLWSTIKNVSPDNYFE